MCLPTGADSQSGADPTEPLIHVTTSAPPDSRERILDAAEALVTSDASSFSMERVAERAGVSRATVYRRFGSVDGLLGALETERATQARRTDTRSRILDAALVEFVQSTVHGATIQAIAERAGITPMTVYNHFDDKEGLVAALIRDRGPIGIPVGRLAELDGPEAAIHTFVHAAVQLITSQRDLIGLVIAPDPMTRQAFRRIRGTAGDASTALEHLLADVDLPEGAEPRVVVASLMGMVLANAALKPILFGEEVDDPEQLARTITQLFSRAIGLGDAG